jgi:hypothetical protein
MKAKKARRRLEEVDGLLSKVMDGYKDRAGVRTCLDTAKRAVADAITGMKKPVEKKQPDTAATPGQRRLSAAGRKSLSAAAKKRWAIAKSKGMHAVTGRPLHQTA